MDVNIFERLDEIAIREDGQVLWAARAPYRPEADCDLMLVPRVSDWRNDEDALNALARIEAEPWVAAVSRQGEHPNLRLLDEWIEQTGSAIRGGERGDEQFA